MEAAAKIVLSRVTFNSEEEYESLKISASNKYSDNHFLVAADILLNSTNIKVNGIDSNKKMKGIDVFTVLASQEIEKYSSSEENDTISFLKDLIDNDWNFEKTKECFAKKQVKLNKPFRTPGGPKKFGVYVRNPKGNVVLVRFGDPKMEIKRDNPDNRKNFRSRHNCDNPGPKWKARYWSCRMWSSKNVSDITSSEIDFENLPTQEEFLSDFKIKHQIEETE